MIASGLKGAARALPHSSRSSASSCAVSSRFCTAPGTQTHQRRPSSSKASCPPGDRSDSSRAATAGAKSADAAPTKSTTGRTSSGRQQNGGRAGRGRKSKDEIWSAYRSSESQRANALYSNLPSVPNTPAISEKDIRLSSLFALHRPLSLTVPVPPAVEQQTFDKIFEPAHPSDVVSALSSTIDTLEQGTRPDSDLHWQVLDASQSNQKTARHLDGQPQQAPRNIEELVARMKPYHAPEPPKAMDAASSARAKARKTKQSARQPLDRRTLEATIILREQSPAVFSAELASLRPMHQTQHTSKLSAPRMRESFGRRLRISRIMRRLSPTTMQTPTPQNPYKAPTGSTTGSLGQKSRLTFGVGRRNKLGQGTWRAISVRRQRKLKMKKHKYKKLMKRTRTDRRRLNKT